MQKMLLSDQSNNDGSSSVSKWWGAWDYDAIHIICMHSAWCSVLPVNEHQAGPARIETDVFRSCDTFFESDASNAVMEFICASLRFLLPGPKIHPISVAFNAKFCVSWHASNKWWLSKSKESSHCPAICKSVNKPLRSVGYPLSVSPGIATVMS